MTAYNLRMQWARSFFTTPLASVMVACGALVFPSALSAHTQIIGLASVGVSVGATGSLPNLLFLVTTVLAIGVCLIIARRLWVVQEERNAAWNKVGALEALSERDPLTGLMNRRVAADRFAELHRQGFDTFALIDLDQFKTVNDRFGHQIGDRALIASANALRGHDEGDHVAVRLGGEEFVVLLRGPGAFERAEALRQSIPVRVAREVEGLGQPVTASMGLIELPRDSHEITTFETLYSRADQLLYNAKASGRNRTCFERLTVFKDAPPMRPGLKSAA